MAKYTLVAREADDPSDPFDRLEYTDDFDVALNMLLSRVNMNRTQKLKWLLDAVNDHTDDEDLVYGVNIQDQVTEIR